MSDVYRSALSPDPEPLVFGLIGSVVLHVLVAATLIVGSVIAAFVAPPKPLMEIESMEVSVVMLPHATRAPDKATAAPRTKGDTPLSADAPKTTEPPPPKESDLAFQDPNAKAPTPVKPTEEKTAGTQGSAEADRQRRIRELMMQQMVDDAAEGEKDRQATDPNSQATERIDLGGSGANADPELARYLAKLRALFMAHFDPLPAVVQANPNLKTVVRVEVDPDSGKVTGYTISKPSGNASFDGAAERAVQAVDSVPLPPEKYKDRLAVNNITFEPP